MLWLGGRHNGYPRCTSLGEYTWARWTGTRRPDKEDQALWQSAMTFGVFEAISPWHVPEDLFLETRSDGRVFFTFKNANAFLVHLLTHYIAAEDEQVKVTRARYAHTVVHRASLAMEESLNNGGDNGNYTVFRGRLEKDPEIRDIFCSLSTMFDALVYVFHGIAQEGALEPSLPRPQWISNSRATAVYRSRRLTAGWCPSIRSSELLQWKALLYALEPPVRNHPDEHRGCTEGHCIVHNINDDDYTVQHTIPDCTCSFLSPPLPAVRDLLSAGRIPILFYDNGSIDVGCADDRPYLAISHVWADGLGSTSEAGIPKCQVERISAFANRLLPGGRAAFWVDALCVPEDRDLRKRAIRLMAGTYRCAAKVLVLDSGIRRLCSLSKPLEENLFRISTSAWMQRVWTLQEALLAMDLYFEFAGGDVVASQYLHEDAGQARLASGLWWHAFSPLLAAVENTNSLRVLIDSRERGSEKRLFGEITGMLSRRTTQKPEDEALAVAGLLDVDTGTLLQHDDQAARTREFLLAIRTIPARILFRQEPGLVRLPDRPYRWAPRSLTDVGPLGWDCGAAVCDERGLTTELEMDVLELRAGPTRLADLCAVEKAFVVLSGKVFLIRVVDECDDSRPFEEVDAIVAPPGTFIDSEQAGVTWVAVMKASARGENGGGSSRNGEPIKYEFGLIAGALPMDVDGLALKHYFKQSEDGHWAVRGEANDGDTMTLEGHAFASRVTVM